MHKLGYTSVFCPKFKSPCLDQTPNFGPDGCTIFYRLSKFQIVNMSCEKIFTDSEINSQIFIILCLKHKQTGTLLTVVCLHLKAKESNHERRAKQISEILRTINTHLYAIDNDLNKHAVLVCGDFNGEPFEQFYDLMIKVSELGLKDAYSIIPSQFNQTLIKEPTSIKYRNEDTQIRRAIDYVFFSEKKLQLTGYLELPINDPLINQQGLPNLAFSSDHLSLVCDFKLNP
jgi:mRNA deadenylase 3'-5' endonuclease subunit Ccr4